jgi:hypothetical protein
MTTQYTMNLDTVVGTSNISFLLDDTKRQVLRLILPRDVEKVFGPGLGWEKPGNGYEDSEWYWVSSKKQVWGIGWRWGQARLRGRGMPNHGTELTKEDAIEFVSFLVKKLA